MFLDTVNFDMIDADLKVSRVAATATPYEVWKDFPHSSICHHGTSCCESAREWFLAMDQSQLGGESPFSGPRWIRARYEWGPSAHPIYWCEAVKRKTLDCGALAALANESFRERGICSFPAQLIQRYSRDATAHWEGHWKNSNVSTHWIQDSVIYHEGCVVLLGDGNIQLWDASAAWWVNPSQTTGYGSIAALRISTGGYHKDVILKWGTHQIKADEWTTF
jgi:hypothetical protein